MDNTHNLLCASYEILKYVSENFTKQIPFSTSEIVENVPVNLGNKTISGQELIELLRVTTTSKD